MRTKSLARIEYLSYIMMINQQILRTRTEGNMFKSVWGIDMLSLGLNYSHYYCMKTTGQGEKWTNQIHLKLDNKKTIKLRVVLINPVSIFVPR